MFEKIWQSHVVHQEPGQQAILYVDLHLVHEVTSPQAFAMVREQNLSVPFPERTFATVDHIIPTTGAGRQRPLQDPLAEEMLQHIEQNTADFGINFFSPDKNDQGIVHIIGPEQGFTLPGTTLVCGDSHTATHGAFGSLAFGIGTTEVEHVLATQTLLQMPLKNMRITVDGDLPTGVVAKDLILAVIGEIGTAGGTG